MCRYAMKSYKPHYACFKCRKTFKRRLLVDVLDGLSNTDVEIPAKCPECSELMANMGLDFEAPRKKDIKAWQHLSTLYEVGIAFHSCGCSGPGFIPTDSNELINHLSKIKLVYLEHQHFWAKRANEPETENDIFRDNQNNIGFLYGIPAEMRGSNKHGSSYDFSKAQKYWGEKVADVQKKIDFVTD